MYFTITKLFLDLPLPRLPSPTFLRSALHLMLLSPTEHRAYVEALGHFLIILRFCFLIFVPGFCSKRISSFLKED